MSEPVSGARDGLPSFRYVDDEGLADIHEAALAVLEEPGIRVVTEAAREFFLSDGCSLTGEDIIHIPGDVTERALKSAPNRFSIYDRNGHETLRLNEGNAYFGAGVTCLYYLDPATGERREYAVPDIGNAAKVTDALENLDFLATPGVTRPTDEMRVELANQYEFRAMASNTTKPMIVLIADGPSQADVYEMAEVIAGGREAFAAKPFVVPYLNTVSPLVMALETCDKLIMSAERGVPVVTQAAPQLGATAPITPAGAVVLSGAETLSGLVLSQLVNPGTPFISGVVPFAMEMRWASVSTGGAPGLMFQSIMADLCHRRWDLPMVGVGAGAADSKLVDQQKALESAYYTFGAVLSGVDLMFDAGSLDTALTWGPEALVMDDEIIAMIRGFLEPVDTSPEALGLDTIRAVGPGEHFLSQPHTLDRFRDVWSPNLLSWEGRSQWEQNGGTTLGERARQRAVELLETHEPESLDADVLAEFAAIIERRRALLPDDDD